MAETLSLKVTQASLNQTALDWAQNMANIYAAIDKAVAEGSDILALPELCLTGYEVNDDFQRTDNSRIYEALQDIAAYAKAKDPNLMVSVGHPWRLQMREAFENAANLNPDPDMIKNSLYDRMNLPFNTQTLLCGGEIVSMTAKAHLYSGGRGHEKRNFSEWSFRDVREYAEIAGFDWSEYKYGTIPLTLPDGKQVPYGRPIIYITDENGNGCYYSITICEDKWVATKFDGFPENDSRFDKFNVIPSISRYLGTKDGLVIESANASPPARLKQDAHRHINDMASNYCDVFIDTDGLGTSGSALTQFGLRHISQNGETISAGQRMKFGQLDTTTSVVQIHNADPAFAERAHTTLKRKFKNAAAAPQTALTWEIPGSDGAWDNPDNPDRWKEERIRHQALWKFDYMRKSGSKGTANALSGGQDSGFNVTITRVMIELGMHDLGVEGFCDELNLPYKNKILDAYAKGGKKAAIRECMDNMLTVYHMPTNNNSEETGNAARALIEGGFDEHGVPFEGIGGKFVERSVQDLVTMAALIFGLENSTKLGTERILEIFTEYSKFVHASPHEYTPEQMEEWSQRLQKEFPELLTHTSAAKPGHEVGYENFQARIRTVLIWAAANIEGKTPEANPNLDEAYGAYATGAGDLHGGTTNPNGGIHKDEEQALIGHLVNVGLQGVVEPIEALRPIYNNRPSAGLQPKKDGEVAQFDEDALQGSFPQKTALARARHHTTIHDPEGDRVMNAGELFRKVREDERFQELDDNRLFNAVVYFYQRWEGPAQHKIFFSAIAPTFGENVDKQTSLRIPNLSGQSRDEIIQLGIDLMFGWAEEDGLEWSENDYRLFRKRAWQDKAFQKEFIAFIRNTNPAKPNMSFDLRALYEKIRDKGWDGVFKPLNDNHPLRIIEYAPTGTE